VESVTFSYTVLNILISIKFKLVFLLTGTVLMFIVPVVISCKKPEDLLVKAKLIELVDNSFVPSYLGYFFVAMSVDNFLSMISFYILIFLYMLFSGVEYFNPFFLFMGYHIYKVESDTNVQLILILKHKHVIRNSNQLDNLKLYRINNLTYIGVK